MPQSLGPELKVRVHVPYISVSPYRKAVNQFCLPGFSFCLNSVFTHPVTEHFYLRHMIPFPFKCPNFMNSGDGLLQCSSWERVRKVAPRSCLLLGPCLESGHPTVQYFWFMETLSSPQCWGLCCIQIPLFFLWPWGSWGHILPPGIPPCFVSWAPLRQNFKSTFLHSSGGSLCPVYLPIYHLGFMSPHLLTCKKVATFLFVEL